MIKRRTVKYPPALTVASLARLPLLRLAEVMLLLVCLLIILLCLSAMPRMTTYMRCMASHVRKKSTFQDTTMLRGNTWVNVQT